MKFHLLYASSVSACFELENANPYYAETAYDVTVNGAPALLGERTNVFSLFDLTPGTEYTVAVGDCSVRIETKPESACISVRDFGAVGDGIADDGSLRGSSEVVATRIKEEIQSRVEEAGLEIVDARITYLAYAPEIAAVMLQRQQASAIVDARKLIIDGAVGMVEMALERLNENDLVTLDDERKAAMVSNLLVVLCGNHDAQPIVNTGSLY